MASRQIKMPVKDDSDKDVDEAPSQRKRPEAGRYWLQVDRQTKGSYTTLFRSGIVLYRHFDLARGHSLLLCGG